MLPTLLKNSVIYHGEWVGNLLILIVWIIACWLANNSEELAYVLVQLDIVGWEITAIGGLFWLLSLVPSAWQISAKNKPLVHLCAVGLALLLFWVLYHAVLKGWWTFDDPYILQYVHEVGPFAGFFNPNKNFVWYTPFLPLSFGIDFYLFGLHPAGFYWHHLLSCSTTIVLLYLVLQRFFAPLFALFIISLFIISVPMVEAVHYMMVRHYIEGLALSLIAIAMYIQAVEKNQQKWAIVGSLFYFLATTAKELYVPLVIVLACFPIDNIKNRLNKLIPYAIVAFLYVILRFYMLRGNILSAYPEQSTNGLDILLFPVTVAKIMGWQTIWQILPILVILVIFTVILWKKPITVGFSSLIWISVVFLPLVPILWRIPMLFYYLFVFGLVLWVGCGMVFNYLAESTAFFWRKPLISIIFFSLFFNGLLSNQTNQFRVQIVKQNWEIQGKFLLHTETPNTVLIYDYHVVPNLLYLRDKVIGLTQGIKWCQVEDCLCASSYVGHTAWSYQNGQWQTKKLELTGKCEQTADLSIILTIKSLTTVMWDLGPYTQGQYYILTTLDGQGRVNQQSALTTYKLPQTGKFTFVSNLTMPFTLLVKYRSPTGWETYSEPLWIDPTQFNENNLLKIVWRRIDGKIQKNL